jgi:hypothetical protein
VLACAALLQRCCCLLEAATRLAKQSWKRWVCS